MIYTFFDAALALSLVQSSWNVMAHGDAREWKWRGNWRIKWVSSTLYTTSEDGLSSITTADAHTSAASSRLNWRPRRFKWIRPFHRKTKSGFCTCAITFQTLSNYRHFDTQPSYSVSRDRQRFHRNLPRTSCMTKPLKGGFTHSMPRPCRSPAMPCR
jgi:hypothetical protein